MIIVDEIVDGSSRVLVWRIDEDYDTLLSFHPDSFEMDEAARNRFKSVSRRLEWLAVRVLLYKALGRNVLISYASDGAPLLPPSEGMNISISHTIRRYGDNLRGYAAIILSPDYNVGIDIEMINQRVDRVKSKFIRDDEVSVTNISSMIHWSAKESLYKLLRHEGLDFINDLFIHPFEEKDCGVICADEYITNNRVHVRYWVSDDYVMTTCHYR